MLFSENKALPSQAESVVWFGLLPSTKEQPMQSKQKQCTYVLGVVVLLLKFFGFWMG
jgi:hypothetical protein